MSLEKSSFGFFFDRILKDLTKKNGQEIWIVVFLKLKPTGHARSLCKIASCYHKIKGKYQYNFTSRYIEMINIISQESSQVENKPNNVFHTFTISKQTPISASPNFNQLRRIVITWKSKSLISSNSLAAWTWSSFSSTCFTRQNCGFKGISLLKTTLPIAFLSDGGSILIQIMRIYSRKWPFANELVLVTKHLIILYTRHPKGGLNSQKLHSQHALIIYKKHKKEKKNPNNNRSRTM